DALFGQGEFPSFHSGMETSVSSEHVVYDQKYQVRIKYNQCSATQWLHADHVDIRRYCQRTHKLIVFNGFDRTGRDICRPSQKIVKSGLQASGETCIDHFESRHTSTHNMLLSSHIVGADAGIGYFIFRTNILLMLADAVVVQQCIDVMLSKEVFSHDVPVSLNDEGSEQDIRNIILQYFGSDL